MALNVYRAIVSIPNDDGLPEDACINTWHFKGTSGASTVAADTTQVILRLQDFYQAIDGQLYPTQIGAAAAIKVYNLSDTKPRIPADEGDVVLTPTGGASLPPEVAACLSYQATPASGIPQARRRGRIFLGPLNTGVLTHSGGKTLWEAVSRAAVGAAATTLITNTGTNNIPWAVYSPTSAAFDGDIAAAFVVGDGWLDDTFDTIRSRGVAATTRTLFT